MSYVDPRSLTCEPHVVACFFEQARVDQYSLGTCSTDYRPLADARNSARLRIARRHGVQEGDEQNVCGNRAPNAATRSIFGVATALYPAPPVCQYD